MEHSVLYTGCVVEEGAVLTGAVVMPNTVVKSGSVISYAIVGEGCTVEGGAVIGQKPEEYRGTDWGIAVVGHDKTIPSDAVIRPGEVI